MMIANPAHRAPRAASPSVVLLVALAMLTVGCGDGTDPGAQPLSDASPAGLEHATHPTVLILEPANGAELPAGDVRVVLGAEHITIVPAGDTSPNSGHHHLLLNVAIPAEGEAIPAGETGFVHLGQAQTEYTFEALPAGEYTLIGVIGDFAHRVIPQVTDSVRFTVLPVAQ